MVALLFLAWGFLTSLNNVLIPELKSLFDISYGRVMLVQSAFFGTCFVLAFPCARLIERIGYRKTMAAGLATMGVGALLFLPAAHAAIFELFLFALIVIGTGIAMLQVSSGPYVCGIGPAKTAASRMNLALGMNSLGATLAPSFGAWLLLRQVPLTKSDLGSLSLAALHATRLRQASTFNLPYLGIALGLGLLATLTAVVGLPEFLPAISKQSSGTPAEIYRSPAWKYLLLSAFTMFLYVGAEVSIGSFLVNYLHQPDIGAMTEQRAAFYVSLYWGGAMAGRFAGWFVQQRMSSHRVLSVVSFAAIMLVGCSLLSSGHVAMWSMVLVGLFNSVMVPCIFSMSIENLGSYTSRGSAVMVAAVVGGAVIPVLQGLLADHIGIHSSFVLPAFCYVFIAGYALFGRILLKGNLITTALAEKTQFSWKET